MLTPRALAVLLAFPLLVASAAPAASVARPTWTAGDFWTYRTNTTLIPGLGLTGTTTWTFTGTQSTSTASGSVAALRTLFSGSGTASGNVTTSNGTFAVQGTWILTGEERDDPVSLHPLYSLLDLSVTGNYTILVPLPFSLRVQNTTTFQILADHWTYPMVVGTGGNVTLGYNFTQDIYNSFTSPRHETGTGEWTVGFSLGANATLITPAGAFEAYPLRQDAPDGSWQRLFYAPAAGNDARTESYDRGGNLTSVGTLVAYRYQAAQPSGLLGLSPVEWGLVIGGMAATAAVVLVFVRKSRNKKAIVPPEDEAAREPTSGPRDP